MTTKIAFIGVGNMGSAIAPHLVARGHDVLAWNRRPEVVRELAGVILLGTPADAFAQADVVITLLADDQAVRDVVLQSGALAAARAGVVHVVMSTLSPALVAEMQPLHRQAQVAYVAAPVFGVPAVAARAELNILAAGTDDAMARVLPIFEAIGKKTWRLGTNPIHANIAKLAGNMMIAMAIEAMSEAAALTEGHGLAAGHFLDVVTQTLFSCPSYQRYGDKIANRHHEPGFALRLGLKDLDLVAMAAADQAVSLPGAEVVRERMSKAFDAGLGELDWSAFAQIAPSGMPPYNVKS